MAVAAATRPSPSQLPLIVWRISKAGHESFDGEGARLYGGRWNHPGARATYTSESLSLAALEYFVNLDTDLVPDGLVSVRAEIPTGLEHKTIEAGDLPGNWRTYPAPEALQDLGTEWIRRCETVVLSVPSAVVPEERNYLLNPAHEEFSSIRVGSPRPFHFDPRMWK